VTLPSPRVSIIIPAYNEGQAIITRLDGIMEAVSSN
jgi:glycosyltransferase involved in cell wall biosynthesis